MGKSNAKYGNVKPGLAADLGNTFYRSGWERDVARFLNLLQAWNVIEGWAYEPQEFSFQGLGYKRGPFTYKPDFVVRFKGRIRKDIRELVQEIFEEKIEPHKTLYIEVKGQETGRDRSKWRRFRKHTGYPLEVIGRTKMLMIQEGFKPYMLSWESKVR